MKWFQSHARDQLIDPHREARLFRSRSIITGVFCLLLIAVLLGRLFFLQIVSYTQYSTASTNNRVRLNAIAPARGLIFDRNGSVLAHNLPSFQLEITSEEVDDIEITLQQISEYLSFSERDVERFRKALKRAAPFEGVPLRFRMTEREVARFSVVQHDFPGVRIVARLRRHYPQESLAGHTIGYVGRIDEKEQEKLDPVNYRATQEIGKIGIEQQFESMLHGTAGYQQVEVNVEGRVLRVLEEQAPTEGAAIYLTLDSQLQRVAEKALGDNNGAVVAMDPQTGEILAMVSKPAFDINLFVDGISIKNYARLREDWRRPLFNRALSGTYPPGSIIKPVMALAGLETGVVNRFSKIYCPGFYSLPNEEHKYRDWKRAGHGFVDLDKSLVESCDVMFYDLSYKLGIDEIASFFSDFGFGRKTGVDASPESAGILPSREWKQEHYGQIWYPGETLIAGIGQGYFTATPLQLTQAISILATRGKINKPHFLYAVQPSLGEDPVKFEPPKPRSLKLSDDTNWDYVLRSMRNSVSKRRGTAHKAFIGANYKAAGKTGTAQVFSVAQDEEYDKDLLEKRLQDHALFTGYAPIDNPQLTVSVVVENGGGGGAVAAPIAREIFDAWLFANPEVSASRESTDKQDPG